MNIPNTPTIEKIYSLYKNDEPRSYLGCSEVGDECARKAWISFKGFCRQEFDGIQLRMFETGNIQEKRIVSELERIGIETHCQVEVVGMLGHLRGHIDAIAKGFDEAPSKWHVVEIKTHNKKSFDELTKKGVAQSKPKHLSQIMLYMGLSELKDAIYIAHCKDNDELYFERISFNEDYYSSILARATRIIGSKSAPERIAKDRSFYLCKMCSYSNVCFGLQQPEKSCRSCKHQYAIANGEWHCFNGSSLCESYQAAI